MSQQVDAVFTALADPTRRLVIEVLTKDGANTATGLASVLPMTRQAVSKHLDILQRADLLKLRQRGRDKFYYLNPEPLEQASLWISAIAARWDERLASLNEFLELDTKGDTNVVD
jgi:DNA-binding transcriptional ArsR family regulator